MESVAEVAEDVAVSNDEPTDYERNMGVHKYPYGWIPSTKVGYACIEHRDADTDATFNKFTEIMRRSLSKFGVPEEGTGGPRDFWISLPSCGKLSCRATSSPPTSKAPQFKGLGPRFTIQGLSHDNQHRQEVALAMRAVWRMIQAS